MINQSQVAAFFDSLAQAEFENTMELTPYEYLLKRFRSEYGWMIARKGEQAALAEWLQGCALSYLPVYNSEIIELAYEWGWKTKGKTEKGRESAEQKILDNWWNFSASWILKRARFQAKKKVKK